MPWSVGVQLSKDPCTWLHVNILLMFKAPPRNTPHFCKHVPGNPQRFRSGYHYPVDRRNYRYCGTNMLRKKKHPLTCQINVLQDSRLSRQLLPASSRLCLGFSSLPRFAPECSEKYRDTEILDMYIILHASNSTNIGYWDMYQDIGTVDIGTCLHLKTEPI